MWKNVFQFCLAMTVFCVSLYLTSDLNILHYIVYVISVIYMCYFINGTNSFSTRVTAQHFKSHTNAINKINHLHISSADNSKHAVKQAYKSNLSASNGVLKSNSNNNGFVHFNVRQNKSVGIHRTFGKDIKEIKSDNARSGSCTQNPFLQPAKFNTDLDLHTYMNINSPGFVSRIVQRATESHLIQDIHSTSFHSVESGSNISSNPSKFSQYYSSHRISPPLTDFLDDSLFQDNTKQKDISESRSMINSIREASRKRNYVKETNDDDDVAKRTRKTEYIGNNDRPVQNSINETSTNTQNKRSIHELNDDGDTDSTGELRKKKCDQRAMAMAKLLSYHSSMHAVRAEAKKRKAEKCEKAEQESSEANEKHRKIQTKCTRKVTSSQLDENSDELDDNASKSDAKQVASSAQLSSTVPVTISDDHCNIDNTSNNNDDDDDEYAAVNNGTIVERDNDITESVTVEDKVENNNNHIETNEDKCNTYVDEQGRLVIKGCTGRILNRTNEDLVCSMKLKEEPSPFVLQQGEFDDEIPPQHLEDEFAATVSREEGRHLETVCNELMRGSFEKAMTMLVEAKTDSCKNTDLIRGLESIERPAVMPSILLMPPTKKEKTADKHVTFSLPNSSASENNAADANTVAANTYFSIDESSSIGLPTTMTNDSVVLKDQSLSLLPSAMTSSSFVVSASSDISSNSTTISFPAQSIATVAPLTTGLTPTKTVVLGNNSMTNPAPAVGGYNNFVASNNAAFPAVAGLTNTTNSATTNVSQTIGGFSFTPTSTLSNAIVNNENKSTVPSLSGFSFPPNNKPFTLNATVTTAGSFTIPNKSMSNNNNTSNSNNNAQNDKLTTNAIFSTGGNNNNNNNNFPFVANSVVTSNANFSSPTVNNSTEINKDNINSNNDNLTKPVSFGGLQFNNTNNNSSTTFGNLTQPVAVVNSLGAANQNSSGFGSTAGAFNTNSFQFGATSVPTFNSGNAVGGFNIGSGSGSTRRTMVRSKKR